MNLKRFAIVVCFALLSNLRAAADLHKDLESELRHLLEKNLLTLRNPYTARVLNFDSQGNLTGKSDVGPWTINGVLQIKRLWLRDAGLEIEGNRILIALGRAKDNVITPILTDQPVHITLELVPPFSTAREIEKAMASIFGSEDLQLRMDDYWKPAPDLDSRISPGHKREPNSLAGTLAPNRPVFFVGPPAVTAPKATSAPDPSYSESARQARVHGKLLLMVVVNEFGVPEILKLVRSLEPTLDIQALVKVSTWRFQPATKEGKPVPVVINVEVSFRLV